MAMCLLVHLEPQLLSTCLACHGSSVATNSLLLQGFLTVSYCQTLAGFWECHGDQASRVPAAMELVACSLRAQTGQGGAGAGTEEQTTDITGKIEGNVCHKVMK